MVSLVRVLYSFLWVGITPTSVCLCWYAQIKGAGLHSYLNESMTLYYSLPETFVGLLNELGEVSFQPSHIKGGFRGSGLYPLSRAAIHPSKLARHQEDQLVLSTG